MRNSFFIKTILIAAGLPLLAGCVERQVVYRDRPVYAQQPPPGGKVVVEEPDAPPPIPVEVIPASPGPAFVWIGGSWAWRGHWVWIGGRWAMRPRPGAVWVRGYWIQRHHRHVWVEGHWN